ncbi:MAG TPA: DUF58 domain-containing protein, partial [Polyangiaceae bacterium LLY-WYZ-15_(1-7)]|nr:DUF58 domain-containing protein [Polyangiaceae bacterium LLY-WYZ-15_(1-7)]
DLFDEEFQRRLEYLAIVARRVYAGRMRAERRSKKTGAGIEFADHRDYVPGDDFRYLDWNVYQRTGRLLVRLFEEEEDLSVYVLLDTSRSMGMGSPRKIDYGKKLAAALGYVALANLDRVSILSFTDRMEERLAPTRGKNRIFKLFEFLRPLQPDGETGLQDALKTFAAQNKRRGIAILISDLYDPAGFEDGINQLRYAKFEPYVIHLFDPIEVEPPLHGDVRLVDHETGEARDVTITPRILAKYKAAHEAYRKEIADFCGQKQVAYHALRTDVPFDEAILSVLRSGGLVR